MGASDTRRQGQPVSQISGRQLTRNSLFSLAANGLSLPISLLLSRFVVHQIGLSSYGIWAALLMVLGYGSVLNLGVAAPLTKYAAEYVALGKKREVNALLSTAMLLYAALSTVFAVAMILGSGWILSHLFHAGPHAGSLRVLFFAMVFGFAMNLTFGVLFSLITGLQRADLVAKLNMGFTLLSAAGTVAVLRMGLGVGGLALNWVIVNMLLIAGAWVVARRLFPTLALTPREFSRDELGKLTNFGAKVQVTAVTLTLNDQVDRTLISYALGTELLGYYQLAQRAANAISSTSFALMSGIMPAMSDLAAVGQETRFRAAYLRSSKYLAIVDFGLCAVVAALAKPLVWLWLGPGYDRVALALMIILAGYAVWLPTQSTDAALQGIARPEIRMRADLAFLVLHIPTSVFLIWQFGFFGTIVGTSSVLAVTRLYMYWAGPPILGVSVREVLRRVYMQPAVAGLLAVVAAILLQISLSLSAPVVLAEAGLVGGVYAAYVLCFALDGEDRRALYSLVTPLLTGAGAARGTRPEEWPTK